jgi:hypothetical protein
VTGYTTMTEIPNYPPTPVKKPVEDAVARSVAKPNAFAKPGSIGKVRVRTTLGDKSVKPRRKKRGPRDKRDVTFY